MNPQDLTPKEELRPLRSDFTSEQIRRAPHLLLLRQIERLDEAMAAGGERDRDVLPAFQAWASAMKPWCDEDDQFQREADALEAYFEELDKRGQCWMSTFEYVALWRPLYFGVLKRAGFFDLGLPQRRSAGTNVEAVAGKIPFDNGT